MNRRERAIKAFNSAQNRPKVTPGSQTEIIFSLLDLYSTRPKQRNLPILVKISKWFKPRPYFVTKAPTKLAIRARLGTSTVIKKNLMVSLLNAFNSIKHNYKQFIIRRRAIKAWMTEGK